MTITALGFGISSLLLVFALPGKVFAQIQITEIMYDAPGADTGREWIEITNTGGEPVDIGKYKLLESDTNHGLVLVSGSKVLAGGASAVIASDAKKFAADFPAYAGTLFDSAFALVNTGEQLVFKTASTTPLDAVLYAPTVGADGEGGSLHLRGSDFIAALPNPGVYPGEIIAVSKVSAPEVPAVKRTVKKSGTPATATKNPAKTAAISVPETAASVQVAAAATAPSVPNLYLWGAACLAVILLGMASVFFTLLGRRETAHTAEEFKIQ